MHPRLNYREKNESHIAKYIESLNIPALDDMLTQVAFCRLSTEEVALPLKSSFACRDHATNRGSLEIQWLSAKY